MEYNNSVMNEGSFKEKPFICFPSKLTRFFSSPCNEQRNYITQYCFQVDLHVSMYMFNTVYIISRWNIFILILLFCLFVSLWTISPRLISLPLPFRISQVFKVLALAIDKNIDSKRLLWKCCYNGNVLIIVLKNCADAQIS